MKLSKEDIKKYGTVKEQKALKEALPGLRADYKEAGIDFEGDKLTADDAVARVNRARHGWLAPEDAKNFTEDYLLTLKEELEKFIERVNGELEFLYDRTIRKTER
jgi:hypothetical protein